MTKPAFLLATAAVAWGCAFFVLLGAAPAATLPLAVAGLSWWSLHRTCAAGRSPRLATGLAALAAAFTVISAASVGVLLAPLALLLGLARATVRTA